MAAFVFLVLCGWFDWKTITTDDFTVVYKEGYEYEAHHVLQVLDHYGASVESLIGRPDRRLPLVIEFVGAVSNGLAIPIFDKIHILTRAPGFSYRHEAVESWFRTVAVHEYAHIAHFSVTRGLAGWLARLFGPLFAPNVYAPGWIIEGITVLGESRSTPYEGRLNDGFFDACIAARAGRGSMVSLVEATNAPLAFPAGAHYLYGGAFFDFLGRQYGAARFAAFFERYGSCWWAPLSGILPCTGLDRAARRTFGRSWPGLFDEWRRYEQARRPEWPRAGRPVTGKGWYMYSLIAHCGRLYYVRDEPFKPDAYQTQSRVRIMEFDRQRGTERAIAHLNHAITTPLRAHGGKLYYTVPQFAHGYANVYYRGRGIIANLHERDLATGMDRVVLTDDIRGFCVRADGSILYSRDRRRGFGSEIRSYDGVTNELLFESERLVAEFAASGDRIVVTARREFENWDIYRLDLTEQNLEPLIATPWIEAGIGLQGDSLFFTANYDATYAVYLYDLNSGRAHRLTRSGYADFGVALDTCLYFIGLAEAGFDLYLYAPTGAAEVYTLPAAVPAVRPDLEGTRRAVTEGGYWDVAQTMVPAVRLPCLVPVQNDLRAWAYGLAFLGGDVTDENLYAGLVARRTVTPDMAFYFLGQSQFFAPAAFAFQYEYRNALQYVVSYPAYWSLESGISSLECFIEGRVFEGATRREFAPGLSLAFRSPSTRLNCRLSLPYERPAWGSQISRSAQRIEASARQILLGGEVRLFGEAYVDPDNPVLPSCSLRGHEPIASGRGLTVTVEYGRGLLRLRRGLWNPNLYFEDLFWTVFADLVWADAGATHFSVGLELRLEAKTGFGFIQFVPRAGIALTDAGAVRLYCALAPELPF